LASYRSSPSRLPSRLRCARWPLAAGNWHNRRGGGCARRGRSAARSGRLPVRLPTATAGHP
jgi:hypothetical protein